MWENGKEIHITDKAKCGGIPLMKPWKLMMILIHLHIMEGGLIISIMVQGNIIGQIRNRLLKVQIYLIIHFSEILFFLVRERSEFIIFF